MIDYTWVAWFEELATKIASNDEHYLADKAKTVDWIKIKVPLLMYEDKNIDPMSFLYFLAQQNTSEIRYKRVFGSVHEVFGITSDLPEPLPIILPPTEPASALFHDGRSFDPNLLWRLFRQAAVPIHESPTIQPDDFNTILRISGVDMEKLTQTLFLANPNRFLPADKTSTVLPQPELHGNVEDYEGYAARMETIKHLFPECEPYEINTFLYIQQGENPLITEKSNFFQISTYVYNDGTDYWEQTDELEENAPFKENHYVYTGGEKSPLTKPKRGDIILVRTGMRRGRAIGVVEDNQYASGGWTKEAAIYVHWINKETDHADIKGIRNGFTGAGEPTISAFRKANTYKVSFGLIDRWKKAGGVESPPGSKNLTEDSNSQTKKPTHPFHLNTILFGPPGTGKTWEATSYAMAIMDDKDPADPAQDDRKARFEKFREEGRVDFVTFHQNYTYEDFIEGIRPVLGEDDLRYELRTGVFKRIASHADKHRNERHVLIIDEINRGNIAKIFGELITLIEPSKRSGGDDAAAVTLPYSQKPFSVPDNLYLVGTMNTADRGIALLDTALRRRFKFIEKMPDLSLVEDNIEGVNGRLMLKAMNERITVYLDREHQIGHTYLLPRQEDVVADREQTIDHLAEVFQHDIVPLLQEYFYDDWEKIWLVLNKNPFIRERKIETPIRDDHSERPVFELLPLSDGKWKDAESYQQIYATEQAQDAD